MKKGSELLKAKRYKELKIFSLGCGVTKLEKGWMLINISDKKDVIISKIGLLNDNSSNHVRKQYLFYVF